MRKSISTAFFSTVSYTHLDVYKRQLLALFGFCLSGKLFLKDDKALVGAAAHRAFLVRKRHLEGQLAACLLYTSRCV